MLPVDLPKIMFNEPSAEWLANRRTYLGASDVAAILGLNPYKTPYSVWLEKTGKVVNDELHEAAIHGQNLEAYVAKLYSALTGRRVIKSRFYVHPSIPFLACNPDYESGRDRLVECKIAGYWTGKNEFGNELDAAPDAYVIQCSAQMMVTGRKVCDLPVLIGGMEFRLYTIPRDEALIAKLETDACEWWGTYVTNDQPPPLTWRQVDSDIANAVASEDDGTIIQADPGLDRMCEQLRDFRLTSRAALNEAAALVNNIKLAMGSAALLECSVGRIKWQTDKGGRRCFKPDFGGEANGGNNEA